MIEDIQQDSLNRMNKSIEAFKTELSKIRTGRAHPSLLNHIMVDFYGSDVPIGQAANINVEDSRTLAVTPWDKSMERVNLSKSMPVVFSILTATSLFFDSII